MADSGLNLNDDRFSKPKPLDSPLMVADIALLLHLSVCSGKLLFFCREFVAELLPEPSNLEECYRWGREFLELFDHGILLVKQVVPSNDIITAQEDELLESRRKFAKELVKVLSISNGRIVEDPPPSAGPGGECDRRLKRVFARNEDCREDSQAVILLRKMVDSLGAVRDRVVRCDGVHLDLVVNAGCVIDAATEWLGSPLSDRRTSDRGSDSESLSQDTTEETGTEEC